MYSLALLLLSFAGTILAAYPYYPNAVPNMPVANQAPHYLVFPQGVYKLVNGTNSTGPNHGHDYVFGVKSPQDRVLLHTRVYKRPGIWSSYASKEITFPPPGSSFRVNITQINANDKSKNGTGGFVKVVRGGIGRENVTMLFKSQRNEPINFELDIYGVPKR